MKIETKDMWRWWDFDDGRRWLMCNNAPFPKKLDENAYRAAMAKIKGMVEDHWKEWNWFVEKHGEWCKKHWVKPEWYDWLANDYEGYLKAQQR